MKSAQHVTVLRVATRRRANRLLLPGPKPSSLTRTKQGLSTAPTRCSFSSTPAALEASATTTTTASRVISRRVWQAHQEKNPAPKKQQTSSSSKEEEKPWPKSVVYASYVAAVTLIPYFSVWIISASPTLREMVWNMEDDDDKNESSMLQRIRRHFGEADPDAISYVDAIQQQPRNGSAMTMPRREEYRLPLEQPAAVRATQVAIRQRDAEPVVVAMSVVFGPPNHQSAADNNVVEKMTLPGSTRANAETLYQQLQKHNKQAEAFWSSGVDGQEDTVPSIAVHFSSSDEATSTVTDNLDEDTTTSSSTTVFSTVDTPTVDGTSGSMTTEDLAGKTTASSDPLLQRVHTYSSWQYQDPDLVLTTQQQPGKNNGKSSSSSSSSASSRAVQQQQQQPSMDVIEKSRLEYEIDQLEKELHTGSSGRPVDDILHELNQNKAKLRQYTWKKWLPW